jgi:hypothetical protein
MENDIDWGDWGIVYYTTYWGVGVFNDISWGAVYSDYVSGDYWNFDETEFQLAESLWEEA